MYPQIKPDEPKYDMDDIREWQNRMYVDYYKLDLPFTNTAESKHMTSDVIRNLLGDAYTFDARVQAVRWLAWKDENVAELEGAAMVNTNWQYEDFNQHILRVEISENGTSVVSLGLGIELEEVLDAELEGDYPNPQALPDWMQERLAVLMLTPSEPPTKEIAGVGRRMSENVFWIYV
jgi:hypothetical protein